jgi:hypothetical protein
MSPVITRWCSQPFRDRNTLTKVGEPTPIPLALIAVAKAV